MSSNGLDVKPVTEDDNLLGHVIFDHLILGAQQAFSIALEELETLEDERALILKKQVKGFSTKLSNAIAVVLKTIPTAPSEAEFNKALEQVIEQAMMREAVLAGQPGDTSEVLQ